MQRRQLIVAVVSLAAGLGWAAPQPVSTAGSLSEADRREILAVTDHVKDAILKEDVEGLFRLISRTAALTCTGTSYPYASVRRFLRDRHSHLFIGLFDSAEFSRRCGQEYPPGSPVISDRDFLQAGDLGVEAALVDADWAKVTIASRARSAYPLEWYFHREARTWKLAGASFVIGSCSCG